MVNLATRIRSIRPTATVPIPLAIWTAIVGMILALSLMEHKREILEMARTDARTAFEKDLVYRRWNTRNGGAYAPLSDHTQPNPCVADLQQEALGVRSHITSLTPIRPENAADPWETKALRTFQKGQKEFSSVEQLDNKTYIRLMRPLKTVQRCLGCHAKQGYRVDDVHGGISVSVPLEPRLVIGRVETAKLCLGFGFLWLLGTGGIIVGSREIRRRIHEQAQLSAMITSMEEGMAFADADDCITEINPYLCRFTNVTREMIIGRNMREIHMPEVFERIEEVLTKFKENPGSEPVFVQRDILGKTARLRVQPIYRQNKYSGAVLNVIDVTELVEARQAAESVEAKLSGKILVAEDNMVSQKVVRAMLEKAGLHVTMVNNGREAVQAATTDEYDLILMDLYMPEMNGMEAMQSLRRSGLDIPIIALTADVMKEDVDKCLVAGFDAHMAKPVDRKKPLRVLDKYLSAGIPSLEGKIDAAISTVDEISQLASEQRSLPDKTCDSRTTDSEDIPVDWSTIINNCQEEEMATMAVEIYIEDAPKVVQKLAEAVKAKAPEGVELHAHSLKGSSALIGANKLSEAARRLEHQGRENNVETFGSLFSEVEKNFNKVMAFVTKSDWMEKAKTKDRHRN